MKDENPTAEATNNDKNIVFKAPNTAIETTQLSETINIELQKYKMKIDLLRWVLGTFAVAIMTIIIQWGFKDRAVGMTEITQYDKYVTDLIVLNDNPIKRRNLAQYFGNITPSNKLRCGWGKYYQEVNKDYNKFMTKDSILRNKSNPTPTDLAQIKKNDSIINNASKLKTPMSVQLEEFSAVDYEKIGFQNLINKDFENAKENFKRSYTIYPTLHNVDEIFKLLAKSNPEKDDAKWKAIYNKILTDYPWGMPDDIKIKFLELSK